MALVFQQLAQLRPNSVNFETLYSPGAGEEIEVWLRVCNTDGGEVLASVCVDNDGAVADETTAEMWNVDIVHGRMPEKLGPIFMNNSSGAIKVRSNVSDGLTFTLEGMIKT